MSDAKRPADWKDILGQPAAVERLRRMLAQDRLPHALLFAGPSGIGKRIVAEVFAAQLLQTDTAGLEAHPDYFSVTPDGAQIKIGQIREMQRVAGLAPVRGHYRICVLEPADCMEPPAANSLLKILEEPPAGLIFILITAFRSWPAWRTFFQISAAIATVVSLLGLFGANTYSSIGNTTYVSGYLIFNLYFLVLLFFRTQSNWRWLYLLPAVIMLFEFWSCHTSGGIIGLAASILLFFLLLGLLHRSRLLRRSALIVFILAVIAVGVIFSQYRSAWFQNSFLKNCFMNIIFKHKKLMV